MCKRSVRGVLDLTPDKRRAFTEVFRALRAGRRTDQRASGVAFAPTSAAYFATFSAQVGQARAFR